MESPSHCTDNCGARGEARRLYRSRKTLVSWETISWLRAFAGQVNLATEFVVQGAAAIIVCVTAGNVVVDTLGVTVMEDVIVVLLSVMVTGEGVGAVSEAT